MVRMLKKIGEGGGDGGAPSNPYPLFFNFVSRLVPDNPALIREAVLDWTDGQTPLDLLVSSGGTGFGERDFTPEVVRPLLEREAPCIAQALVSEGLRHTPLALLSRPVVGVRGHTLIATLPGR
ncbi:hypothetical protein EON64_15640 [archaeon]|nr:MAG: hypothetical protein EON64_15640 [archaeon]